MMDRNMTENILQLTLEIIYLLTGEDYAPVNSSTQRVTRNISHKFGSSWRSQSSAVDHSSSWVHEIKNDEKILDLTKKITQLLTGEIPVRYGDTVVCFTVEEWEYVEGHKELYKYVLIEDQDIDHSRDDDQAFPSPPCMPKAASDIQAKVGTKASKQRKHETGQAKYSSKPKDKLTTFKSKPAEDFTIVSEPCTNERGNFTSDAAYSTPNHCLSSGIKPINNKNSAISDHIEGENTDEQQLSCTGGISRGFHGDVKLGHSESLSCITESPIDPFTDTQLHYVYTPIKEEPVHTQTDNYGPTQYLSTHSQESSWQQTNETGANTYAVGHTQYTLTHSKNESALCEEENSLTSISVSLDDMQAQYTPKPVKVEPVSQEDGYELYIPTDCGQMLHTSASWQAIEDVAKANKRFSATKYKDWNKSPENPPCMNPPTAPLLDGMYVCSTCEKSFTSHFGLVKHQAMHNGNKVSCPQCGKLFFYKSSLVIHQRIHTGEKLFACPVCNKCFTNNSNLVVHQRIHTGEKPFVCPECGKRFGHKGHLNRHLRTHETEKSATNIENYGKNSLQDPDRWNFRKITSWSHNIYGTGPYSTFDKSV
ncbi:gastrula zinc finger protein XlCGF53.1-like isoform X2 [Eleutherodactylus coqui]|uniref:gastrula zinc finger protein XlCGF53.1-like isoform X2 n=1 Tax=Eleutherodactylus coqui TaxID=57060 RepID=UPI003461DA25